MSISLYRKIVYDQTIDPKLKSNLFVNIKKSLLMNDDNSVVYRYATLPVLFLDSYKKLSSRLKGGFATPEEMQMFSVYKDVNNIDLLVELFKKRQDYILYSMECVKDFYEMPVLGKINLVKQLSQYENIELCAFSRQHLDDLNNYVVDVDEDFLYNFYKRYSNKLDELEYCYDEITIFSMIAGFIQNSYVYDAESTYNLICKVNETIFCNIDKFEQELDVNDKYINELKYSFYNDSENFNNLCLYENGILIDVLTIYMKMRDIKIIKGKTYKNERNE